MTYFIFELFLWDAESEQETKKLLRGKVLAEKRVVGSGEITIVDDLSCAVDIFHVSENGKYVLGEYHISAEDDFVLALRKHVDFFSLDKYTEPKEVFKQCKHLSDENMCERR